MAWYFTDNTGLKLWCVLIKTVSLSIVTARRNEGTDHYRWTVTYDVTIMRAPGITSETKDIGTWHLGMPNVGTWNEQRYHESFTENTNDRSMYIASNYDTTTPLLVFM